MGLRVAAGSRISVNFGIEIDHRIGRHDPFARGAPGKGGALSRWQHRQQRARASVIGPALVLHRAIEQAIRQGLAKCGRKAEAPRVEILHPVPFNLDAALPAPGCPRKPPRQQHVDSRRRAPEQGAIKLGGRERAFAGIGVADRLPHLPLAILARGALQPHRRTRAGDITTAEIGVERFLRQAGRPVSAVDILHHRAGERIFAHPIEHADAQRCKLDWVHAKRRSQTARKCSAHEDVPPARHHRPACACQNRAHQLVRLIRERRRRQPALVSRQHADPGQSAPRTSGDIGLGL